jgi:hypothetical protein
MQGRRLTEDETLDHRWPLRIQAEVRQAPDQRGERGAGLEARQMDPYADVRPLGEGEMSACA